MNFKTVKINDCKASLAPLETDLVRAFSFLNITVPYFWDSEISLDMVIIPTRKDKTNKPPISWEYKWELWDLDDNIIKNGHGTYEFKHLIGIGMKRKTRAITLGFLKPHKNYALYVSFKDDLNCQSEPKPMFTFSVKDRDEYQMQLFLIIFSICMTLLFGFIAKKWGM